MKKVRKYLVTCFICIIVILNTFVSILYNNYWLASLSGILGLISIYSQARGIFFAPVIGIADSLCYGIFAYQYNYIGEFIVYIFILIPIYIYSTIQWIIHKNTNNKISPRNLTRKEIKCLILLSVIIITGSYFLLTILNSDQKILNTLSIYTLTFSNYLLSRRCIWGFVYYILNDLILITLWLITLVQGNVQILSFFISIIAYFICDIYGIFNWIKLKNGVTL